jgi:hypothetical protein
VRKEEEEEEEEEPELLSFLCIVVPRLITMLGLLSCRIV